MRILIVSSRKGELSPFAGELEKISDGEIIWAGTGALALSLAKESSPDLVVLEENLPDTSARKLLQDLLMVNAFMSTAVISRLDEADFHEEYEGFGVLGRIALGAGPDQAVAVWSRYQKVAAL